MFNLKHASIQPLDQVCDALSGRRKAPNPVGRISQFGLTCGVDVQHDRLESVTLAHSRTETFVVDARVFWVPVNDSDVPWAELDAFLAQTYIHPSEGILRMDAVAVDSSDGQRRRLLCPQNGCCLHRVRPLVTICDRLDPIQQGVDRQLPSDKV